MDLLTDIEIPDRAQIRTVGDMAKIIVADERAIRLKNADLAAIRVFYGRD